MSEIQAHSFGWQQLKEYALFCTSYNEQSMASLLYSEPIKRILTVNCDTIMGTRKQ